MRFIADKEEMLKGIGTAIRACSNKVIMPIFQCVLISAESDRIYFTCNNLDQTIRTYIPATVEESGAIAVDAKMFSDIIRKMPSNDISFTTGENFVVELKSGRSKFTVPGRDAEEFTGIPEVSAEKSFEISQAVLKSMVQETIFSVSTNESRQVMTGEQIYVENDTLTIEAVDGYRIAIRNYPLTEHVEDVDAIIPSKALGDISRIISGDPTKMVTVAVAPSHVLFNFDNTTMTVRRIEGAFPDISRILTDEYTTKVIAKRDEVIACTERAGLFTRDNDKKPILLDIKDGKIQFSIKSPMGEMSELLDVLTEGRELLIGFNPRFLADALRVIPDDEITMRLTNQKAPCFIANEDKSYIYVILPVNF